MVPLLGKILSGKNKAIKVTLALVLACLILPIMPVTAETPTLHLQGTDLAPIFIYIGETHAEEMNNIVMLQITISTTNSEGVTINSINVHRTGIASDADVVDVCLYEDGNNNGIIEQNNDTLLSTSNSEVGKAEFSVQLTVNQTNPLTLLVALNISSEARSGATIGLDIPSEDYIDTVENADIEFELCICSKNSTLLLDTDGDFNPDTTDLDDDNDHYTDEIEMICGSDSKDPNSIPKDNDKDYVPDSIDTDDDNDGEPDKYDDFPLDESRQRDYTIIYVYALIVAILIIIMIFLGWKRKPKGPDSKALSEEISEDEFDIDIEGEESKIEEEILEGKDEELLD
jgi:hypothetical protein